MLKGTVYRHQLGIRCHRCCHSDEFHCSMSSIEVKDKVLHKPPLAPYYAAWEWRIGNLGNIKLFFLASTMPFLWLFYSQVPWCLTWFPKHVPRYFHACIVVKIDVQNMRGWFCSLPPQTSFILVPTKYLMKPFYFSCTWILLFTWSIDHLSQIRHEFHCGKVFQKSYNP